MQIEYIVREDNTRLLLIFAGWSTDASAFGGLVCPGYDVAVLSGYTDLSVPDDFSGYSEIVVMAWSLGVWAASNVLARYRKLPVTLTVAVNGTETPVSDTEGIPERIYRSTLDGLTAQSLLKFRRRMGEGICRCRRVPLMNLAMNLRLCLRRGCCRHKMGPCGDFG